MSQRVEQSADGARVAEGAPGGGGGGTEVRDDVTEILGDWRRRLRRTRDLKPRDGARGARERALANALLDAARASGEGGDRDEESLRKLAMIAALYGAEQPRERVDPSALCEELGHLRQAVSHHLRQLKLDAETATARILAFDRALSVALRAALSGGFRCAPESVADHAPHGLTGAASSSPVAS